MGNIKAYAYWDAVQNLRTGTMVVVNDNENVVGNVIMKNPGSAKPLEDFSLRDDNRLMFSVDATMHAIVDLFGIKEKGGCVKIYNLSDERNPDYNKAKQSLTASDFDVINEIKESNVPTYIGWGDMWKDKRFNEKAKSIFEVVKTQTKGYESSIENNAFFHPLYLMRYGLNKPECKEVLNRFRNNFIKNENN
jgi:hypothetical protein